jgi:hypothetical protein
MLEWPLYQPGRVWHPDDSIPLLHFRLTCSGRLTALQRLSHGDRQAVFGVPMNAKTSVDYQVREPLQSR